MLYSEQCKTGHLQVDETTVKVMGTFNKLVWSVPRQDVTYIALKKGAMMADLTIYTAYNHFPANFMAGQKAEKFLAFFPNVPVGPEPQTGMQPQGAVQPVPQTVYASQALSEQGQMPPMSPMPSMPGQASQYPQQPLSGQYQSDQPPFYPPGSGMMPSKPPRKKRSRRTWVIVGVVVLILIIIIAVNSGTKGTGNTPAASTSTQPASQSTVQQTTANAPTAIPTKAPTPKPTFASFGDGTYQVGKDIKPGTYRTRVGSPGCYYERLSGFGGTVGDIIANNNTDYPAIVTIAPTDKGFDSQGCGTWTEDLSQITASKTTFSDGIYIIGTDITPGTYKNTGATGCYYARLSGFGGTIGNIIANNNVDTATIVTIAPTDKGFESNGCGTWTKQ